MARWPCYLCLAFLISCGSSPNDSSATKEDDRPNIVLVVLDTVRRDFTGLGEGGHSYTPNLDRLAEESTVFTHAWSTAPWTAPAHASMFTGQLPAVHGSTSQTPRLREDLPTLAGLLSAHGYRTAAFFSNPWLSDEITGALRGFAQEHMVHSDDEGGPEILDEVARWLEANDGDGPSFLFVNLFEAHSPFDPPASLRGPLGLAEDDRVLVDWILEFQAGLHDPAAVDWERYRALYGGDVLWVDELLGRLLELLEGFLGDDGVVVVTSDHGENLGEAGYVEHQFRIDETLLAVPLVVHAPGRWPAGRRDAPALLTDLFVTVLELAGMDEPPRPPHSRSLATPAPARRPLVAEYAGAPQALLRHLTGLNPALDTRPLERSFRTIRVAETRLTVDDLGHETIEGPGEQAPALREGLARILGEAGASSEEELEISEEMRERLRSLGYVR